MNNLSGTIIDSSTDEDEFRCCLRCGSKNDLNICRQCHFVFCIKCARKTYVHWCMHIHPNKNNPYFKPKKSHCGINLCNLF